MKIIKPTIQLKFPLLHSARQEMLELVEEAARLCYKSEGKMGATYSPKFIRDKISLGHLSVIEHSLVTVKIICDRGVTHEIVRHRIASYSQESTRYCNYSKDQFGNEITVIKPLFWEEGTPQYDIWLNGCMGAEDTYFDLLSKGATPQEARSVLPNSLKTEIVVSMNFREWRHFFELRLSKAAHPQIREVALMLLDQLYKGFPVIFEDYWEEYGVECQELLARYTK